jgi:hypothetical protein
VGKLVRGDARPVLKVEVDESTVMEAVQKLIGELGLDSAGDVRALAALALAEKIDACRRSDAIAAANAIPALVKALADALSELESADFGNSPLDQIRARRDGRLRALQETAAAKLKY